MSDEGKEPYEAAAGGDKARVQELIQKGVDVDKWKDPVSVSGRGSYGLAWRWWELGRSAEGCGDGSIVCEAVEERVSGEAGGRGQL